MKHYIFLILTIYSFSVNSQNIFNKKIIWKNTISEKSGSEIKYFLNFEGASYNEDFLPIYTERLKLNGSNNFAEATIVNPAFETLPDDEAKKIRNIDLIKNDVKAEVIIQYERKQKYCLISFVPIRKNSLTGKIEKLISFNLDFKQKNISERIKKERKKGFSTTSVLSNGKWVKIKISKSGIHKITFAELKTYGFQNPENISVFGNGGGMIPLLNATFRYDDLVQNSISFEDANINGTFDEGDYILFYAEGPTSWKYDTISNLFIHTKHLFSDYSFYFLTDSKPVKTISSVSSLPSGNINVTSFDDYAYHETDSLNLIKSGRNWVGEQYDIIANYSFYFNFPNIETSSLATIRADLVARSPVTSKFTYTVNGQTFTPVSIPAANFSSSTDPYGKTGIGNFSFTPSTDNITINTSYDKPNSSSQGWLNYILINVRRRLIMNGTQTIFRDMNSVGSGNIASFYVTNATSDTRIWDITDPLNVKQIIPVSNSGGILIFNASADTLHSYVALNGTSFYSPTLVGTITNQNLHSASGVDFVILSPPDFKSYADQLAEYHRTHDNMTVLVVKPEEVYNEFSSGCPDISSVRDFMRMLYEKAGNNETELPKHLLLFGDGSFDNKSTSSSNTNFILTYQSANSLDPINSFVSDDFYALLDSSEGSVNYNESLDIGVGRFPVKTQDEAKVMIEKVTNYTSNNTLGDWRNMLTFVGDDEDSGQHQAQSNELANKVDTAFPVFNIVKIFLDAYQQISTPTGDRYPDVNTAINNRIHKGTLLFNYTGHGNELGLAHEHVVSTSDIASWDNWNKLSLFMTATCEFSRFDDFNRTSAGELILLNSKGGAIALLSTTRLVYSGPNYSLNISFYNHIFELDNNKKVIRLGEVSRRTKNDNSGMNKRNFTLLGDPALQILIPEHNVVTTKINNQFVTTVDDTIKALSKVTVSGEVKDFNGNKVSGFNGILYPTVYDKYLYSYTKGNDLSTPPMLYKIQNKILFKGKASVKSGEFTFSFIVPKDISYSLGNGKISYYADNGTTDANGFYKKIVVGGISSNSTADDKGPTVNLYMNDESFVFGGITDENPKMLAIAVDSSGINTVGNGIGHDIIAVLDGNTNRAINLNEYYESELDNFQKGKINYDLSSLSQGLHNLKLKVWDVNNNSSDAYTEFIVANSAELVLDHIFNYPNPFTTQTSFYFDHNLPNTELEVQIQIFTVTGKLIKTLDGNVNTTGFRSSPVNWDGKDDFGDKIGRGVYIYRLRVKPPAGKIIDKFEKLVILK